MHCNVSSISKTAQEGKVTVTDSRESEPCWHGDDESESGDKDTLDLGRVKAERQGSYATGKRELQNFR